MNSANGGDGTVEQQANKPRTRRGRAKSADMVLNKHATGRDGDAAPNALIKRLVSKVKANAPPAEDLRASATHVPPAAPQATSSKDDSEQMEVDTWVAVEPESSRTEDSQKPRDEQPDVATTDVEMRASDAATPSEIKRPAEPEQDSSAADEMVDYGGDTPQQQ
jgi:hypothetical protein